MVEKEETKQVEKAETPKVEKHKHVYEKISNAKARCTDPNCGKIKYRSDLTSDERAKLGFKKAFAVISINNKTLTKAMVIDRTNGEFTVDYFKKNGKVHVEGAKALQAIKSQLGLVPA